MDWEISKNSLACSVCQGAFAEDQEIFSALVETPPSFSRRDFCAPCWEGFDKAAAFSHWQTRIPEKDAPVRRFVDDEVVLDFFRRLEGQEEPLKRSFRFVLALLLMRKKTLKFTEFKRTESGGALVLTDRVSGTTHEVPDPGLTEEQIQQVTDEIGQILNARV